MEDLTKQQMVLLTVLVSFVCSAATSVTVVSLLTDAAPTVSQTINNIVEKTIERVVTGTTTPVVIKPSPAPVLSESEKVISAVQENLPKLVIIRSKEKEGESATSTEKIGIGAVISPDGLIATDSSLIGEGTEFIIALGDKYRYAKKVYFDNNFHLAILQTDGAVKGDKSTEILTFSPLSYMKDDAKLGLPIIVLGGENGKSMTRGTLTEVPEDKTLPLLVGDITLTSAQKGGIVFGLDGKAIGVVLSSPLGVPQIFHYSNIISALGDYKDLKQNAAKTQI
ncbi:MAG: serine protease [Candidatus Paceibacterota bacterium]|jgi:hypothetical protein